MDRTLVIKIAMNDGTVIEVVKELDVAGQFLLTLPQEGYRDRATSRFYPGESIVTIEVLPPPAPIEFSAN